MAELLNSYRLQALCKIKEVSQPSQKRFGRRFFGAKAYRKDPSDIRNQKQESSKGNCAGEYGKRVVHVALLTNC